ncbi:MAG: hypothetical protein OXC29_09140, partial [Rhodococcus sp.]|nr:hypothetical protein [Rhodococcus sp. (in: high G+C Gram-positive bacteria)]
RAQELQREVGALPKKNPECPGARPIARRAHRRCPIKRALNVLAPGDDLVLETETAVVDLADSEE